MNVIAKRTLRTFWSKRSDARRPLETWFKIVEAAEWTGPADVKAVFGTTVDFDGDNRVIFDVGGNKFRLVVHLAYPYRRALIKFVGTHKDYDNIDPETV